MSLMPLMLWLLAAPLANDPPAGFVALDKVVPGVRLEVRYHTTDNFTGAPLPGYGAAAAWLLDEPARALARVQVRVAKLGYTLYVYDAYRPFRATLAMVAWAERVGKVVLLDTGYVARRSGHNHGHTIDLTLADAKTGQPIDMGSPWDLLEPLSNTRAVGGVPLANRLKLKEAMEAEGFKAYHKEWWHFGYPMTGTKARDVPYGCFEPKEGEWAPPKGWNTPGFQMPSSFPAEARCL
jgi:D-alanyl-D-alanine dipeptidase